jgi:hypothetical protein
VAAEVGTADVAVDEVALVDDEVAVVVAVVDAEVEVEVAVVVADELVDDEVAVVVADVLEVAEVDDVGEPPGQFAFDAGAIKFVHCVWAYEFAITKVGIVYCGELGPTHELAP